MTLAVPEQPEDENSEMVQCYNCKEPYHESLCFGFGEQSVCLECAQGLINGLFADLRDTKEWYSWREYPDDYPTTEGEYLTWNDKTMWSISLWGLDSGWVDSRDYRTPAIVQLWTNIPEIPESLLSMGG